MLNGHSKVHVQQTASNDSKSSDNNDGDRWHLVGTFKTTGADIKHYYVVPSKINIDNYVCIHIRTIHWRIHTCSLGSRLTASTQFSQKSGS